MDTCLICMKTKSSLKCIDVTYQIVKKQKITVYEMLQMCFPCDLNISTSKMCKLCLKKLFTMFKFRELVLNSYKKFSKNACIKDEAESFPVKTEADDVELKIENPSNNNDSTYLDDYKDESNSIPVNPLEDEKRIRNDKGYEITFKFDAFEIKNETEELNISENSIPETTQRTNCIKKSGRFKCSGCTKMFHFRYQLRNHEGVHYPLKSYFCEICKKYYRCEKYHIQYKHKNCLDFICDICSRAFRRKSSLKEHLDTHNKKEAMRCDFKNCEKIFFSSGGLKLHKLKHVETDKYLCSICSKSFLMKQSFDMHMAIHENLRNYECDVCDKKFNHSAGLTSHKKRHTGRKSYSCEICNKKYSTTSHLKRHKRTHQGPEIPTHSCYLCPRKFSRKDNLTRHIAVIHGSSGPHCIKDDVNIKKIVYSYNSAQ